MHDTIYEAAGAAMKLKGNSMFLSSRGWFERRDSCFKLETMNHKNTKLYDNCLKPASFKILQVPIFRGRGFSATVGWLFLARKSVIAWEFSIELDTSLAILEDDSTVARTPPSKHHPPFELPEKLLIHEPVFENRVLFRPFFEFRGCCCREVQFVDTPSS